MWLSLPNKLVHSRCISLYFSRPVCMLASCCSRFLTLRSQLFLNFSFSWPLRTTPSSMFFFSCSARFFVVDTGVGTREVSEKDFTVVSRTSTVGNHFNSTDVVSRDSFGSTPFRLMDALLCRSPAHIAVVKIFAIAAAQREGSQSNRGTNQLCSLVNIPGFPNEDSPAGREAWWRVVSFK